MCACACVYCTCSSRLRYASVSGMDGDSSRVHTCRLPSLHVLRERFAWVHGDLRPTTLCGTSRVRKLHTGQLISSFSITASRHIYAITGPAASRRRGRQGARAPAARYWPLLRPAPPHAIHPALYSYLRVPTPISSSAYTPLCVFPHQSAHQLILDMLFHAQSQALLVVGGEADREHERQLRATGHSFVPPPHATHAATSYTSPAGSSRHRDHAARDDLSFAGR